MDRILFNEPPSFDTPYIPRADEQAQAVLEYLSSRDGIEESWNSETKQYEAITQVARWENGREQGYVVYMRNKELSKQINIAFFEHRNSDDICAVSWVQLTDDPPTIETMDKTIPYYNDKWAVSHSVGWGAVGVMTDWILEQLLDFWIDNN